MRLAPVPLAFLNNLEKGLEYAENQSYTTHDGLEAAECCRLLTYLVIRLINRSENEDFKEIFDNLGKEFETKCPSVKALAESREENFIIGEHPEPFNKSSKDRNWDWRKKELYEFSPTRLMQNNSIFFLFFLSFDFILLT